MGLRVNLSVFCTNRKINSWFKKNINYHCHGRYRLGEDGFSKTTSDDAKIIIVAKPHYQESSETIASISKKELNQIIELRKKSQQFAILQYSKNDSVDGYDLKTIVIEEQVKNSYLGRRVVFIPESALFYDKGPFLYSIESIGGTLFSGGQGGETKLAFAKGLLNSAEYFSMSIGLPSDTKCIQMSQKEYASFLFSSLMSKELPELRNAVFYDVSDWLDANKLHVLYWAPLVVCFAFLLMTNSYLYFSNKKMNNELANGSSEVSELLSIKREIDKKAQLITSIGGEFTDRTLTHQNWDVIYSLVENGAVLTRIAYQEKSLIIRGNVNSASDMLASISKHSLVQSAAFEGAVRKSRGRDAFVLKIVPKDQRDAIQISDK